MTSSNAPIPFHLEIHSAETIGARTRQEDAYLIHDSPTENHVILTIADGLGGHCDGDIASETAVRESMRALRAGMAQAGMPLKSVSLKVFIQASRALDRIPYHIDYGFRPASTLITAIAYRSGELRLAGIGDSLAWIVRAGEVRELLRPQGFGNHVHHALGYDIGGADGAAVSSASGSMEAGDCLLLATDGLYSLLPEEIVDVLAANPAEPAHALIAAVNEKKEKSQDNCVVIVMTARENKT